MATTTSGPPAYRPPQWSRPAMVSVTVPATATNSSAVTKTALPNGATVPINQTAVTTYVFDAVLELQHEQRLETTNHPVQTGADISSHAYLQPATLSMYVGMSDAMASYTATANAQTGYTPFTGGKTKSVSAYLQMLALQKSRIPLTVTTRLRTYTNMMLVSISPREDNRTVSGLRMRLEFKQIFTAATSTVPVSARAQDTGATGLGQVSTGIPSAATVQQFSVDDSTLQRMSGLQQYLHISGAGSWSSVPVTNLPQLPMVSH